jgi:hypothetical protein
MNTSSSGPNEKAVLASSARVKPLVTAHVLDRRHHTSPGDEWSPAYRAVTSVSSCPEDVRTA